MTRQTAQPASRSDERPPVRVSVPGFATLYRAALDLPIDWLRDDDFRSWVERLDAHPLPVEVI